MYSIKLLNGTDVKHIRNMARRSIIEYDTVRWLFSELELYQKYLPTELLLDYDSRTSSVICSLNWQYDDYYVLMMVYTTSIHIGHGSVYNEVTPAKVFDITEWQDSSKSHIQSILENFNEIRRKGC